MKLEVAFNVEDLILKLVNQYGAEHEKLIRDKVGYQIHQDKLFKPSGDLRDRIEDAVYLRIASIIPYKYDVYDRCPICDDWLEKNGIGQFMVANCPKEHYRYHGLGNYASESIIIIDGKEERYGHDDACCIMDQVNDIRFLDRIRELRGMKKVSFRNILTKYYDNMIKYHEDKGDIKMKEERQEPKWGLDEPINKRWYIKGLIERVNVDGE